MEMPCFLKMPALSPSSGTAVSQLPRWPMVILTRSSAEACAVKAKAAIAAAPVSFPICFIVVVLPLTVQLIPLDAVEPAEAADQRVGANRQHEQHDQIGIHARHIEHGIGVDDEEADALVRELGFREQRADQRDAEAEPDAVDDRMAHGGEVNLHHHLPGVGAETLAN